MKVGIAPNKEPDLFKSVSDFLFKAPLYVRYRVTLPQLNDIFGQAPHNVDGFCPYCHEPSIFVLSGHFQGDITSWTMKGVNKLFINTTILAVCQRNAGHVIRFSIDVKTLIIQKYGQLPSFADIAQDESKTYKRELGVENTSEFHKALGLAAHGVGIGAFVYLRRIFERLICGRFESFKARERWENESFYPKRMSEKIELLRGHLPVFLVDNSKIYSILSLGLHELDEDKCRSFFPVLRDSILVILEEDKAKREELRLKANLAREIADFSDGTSETKG